MALQLNFWKEVLNTTLHIVLGGVLCYGFFPTAEAWVLILFTGGVGAMREHVQKLRGHSQVWWIKYLDAGGFSVGAVLFVLLREFTSIDKLFLFQ